MGGSLGWHSRLGGYPLHVVQLAPHGCPQRLWYRSPSPFAMWSTACLVATLRGRRPSAGASGTRLAAVGRCPPAPESRHEPEHKPCRQGDDRRVDPDADRSEQATWSALYGRQQQQREYLAKDCRGALGRFRLWRELGGKVREIGGAIRGDKEVLGRFRAELEDRLRWQRVCVGKRAFRSGAGDREQGGRILPRGPGRVGETGAGGGASSGRTGSQCVTVGVVTNLTDSRTRCWRSGWSRCGRSTESWLTRR